MIEALAIALVITVSLSLPAVGPLVLVALARRCTAWPLALRIAAACAGPPLGALALILLVWLPQFAGECGGWLGETEPCGLARYAAEAVFWASMSLAMPALIACVTVTVTALVLAARARESR